VKFEFLCFTFSLCDGFYLTFAEVPGPPLPLLWLWSCSGEAV